MADGYLVIPVPTPDAGEVWAESTGARRVILEWVDAGSARVGLPIVLDPPSPVIAESFGAPDGPQWGKSAGDIVVSGEPPSEARLALVSGPGGVVQTLSLESVCRRSLSDLDAAPMVLGEPDAGWRLAVVADGFADAVSFEADLQRLWFELNDARPFKGLINEGLFGIVGLFWRASEHVSLFDARPRGENPWVIHGNDKTVFDAVAASRERHDKVLVLMNRPERGGAGGFDSSRPSWTSNVSAPTERWTQIALHELGHAFGLADEYVTAGNGTPPPDPLEPNVSREGDPAAVIWSESVKIDKTVVPSLAFGEANDYPDDTIGTFQGARYDKLGFFRPSFGCRMQWTTWEFCRICERVIDEAVRK